MGPCGTTGAPSPQQEVFLLQRKRHEPFIICNQFDRLNNHFRKCGIPSNVEVEWKNPAHSSVLPKPRNDLRIHVVILAEALCLKPTRNDKVW